MGFVFFCEFDSILSVWFWVKAVFLGPFAVLYGVVTRLRNWLYDRAVGWYKPNFFTEVFVLSVGNLAVGGSGKTPHVEYLVRLLQGQVRLALLSRGYGRKTKGYLEASPTATPDMVGDEPMQFFGKYGSQVPVVVCEDRTLGIHKLLTQHANTQCVVLDDAFQHRRVRPHLSLVLTEYHRPFFNDYLMPLGRLRESRYGVKRADAVVVTKCPPHIGYKRAYYEAKIRRYHHTRNCPVFFSTLQYSAPLAVPSGTPLTLGSRPLLVVSGIADARLFEAHARAHYTVLDTVRYGDHHTYTLEQVQHLLAKARQAQASILMTEKDAVKWKVLLRKLPDQAHADVPVAYIPIEVAWLSPQDQAGFDALVRNRIRDFTILQPNS